MYLKWNDVFPRIATSVCSYRVAAVCLTAKHSFDTMNSNSLAPPTNVPPNCRIAKVHATVLHTTMVSVATILN